MPDSRGLVPTMALAISGAASLADVTVTARVPDVAGGAQGQGTGLVFRKALLESLQQGFLVSKLLLFSLL